MEKTALTISLPRTMKEFIETKMQEGRFSTPSEYIRSLIRDDQDLDGALRPALIASRGVLKNGTAASPVNGARRRKKV
jgi:putative addiction module CopG family antidote